MSFSPQDMEILASLPYKVGMWISYTDDQEGEADDGRENKALAVCLRQFAKLNEEKPLVSQIINETLRRQDKWVEWADQSFNVILDLKKALPLVKANANAEEFKDFRRMLMEIGTAVAEAFGEFGAFDEHEAESFFGKIIGKFAGMGEAGHPMNVSAAEDSALEKLRAALQGKA